MQTLLCHSMSVFFCISVLCMVYTTLLLFFTFFFVYPLFDMRKPADNFICGFHINVLSRFRLFIFLPIFSFYSIFLFFPFYLFRSFVRSYCCFWYLSNRIHHSRCHILMNFASFPRIHFYIKFNLVITLKMFKRNIDAF